MALGPGKYDAVTTLARGLTHAQAVVLIVINGVHGSGFSVQSVGAPMAGLPDLLEALAADIRATLRPPH